MKRLTFVWAGLGAFVMAMTDKTVAFAQAAASVPQQLVNAFYALFHGPYLGYRANHAKGIVCDGTFQPSAEAPSLSSAAHFQKSVRVTVRFSDFGGIPNVPDNDDLASPHGLAVKFHLPGGSDTDIVGHSVALFPAATPKEFLGFLEALKGGPATVGPYLASHPAAAKFAAAPKPPPVSFATTSYYYINAFKLTNAKGESRFVRYAMKSVAPEASLSPEQAKQQGPNYLSKEIKKRLADGPVQFDYVAQVAEAGDPTDDGTKIWPADRKRVKLGRLTVTKLVPDSDAAQRKLLFDPAHVTLGIAPSDDPVITARSQAYAISYAKRLSG